MAANSENEWNVGTSNFASATKLSVEDQFAEKESWVRVIENVTAIGFCTGKLRWCRRSDTAHDDRS